VPPLSRWFIKAGFMALLTGLIVTVVGPSPFAQARGLPGAALHLVALHLFTVGWLLQLIAGVAFWLFPRHPTRPPRGDERLGWAAFVSLNLGLLLRAVGEPWHSGYGGPAWPVMVSAGMQFAAALLITLLLWPRVRER
jgi:quinol-cytochrome oxidoreductase complex cytochrome b subunit